MRCIMLKTTAKYLFLSSLLSFSIIWGQSEKVFNKYNQQSTIASPAEHFSVLNLNNWRYWVDIKGDGGNSFKPDRITRFPKDGWSGVYKDGLLWGAFHNGTYFLGGNFYKNYNTPLSKIYRIRYDYKAAKETPNILYKDAQDYFLTKDPSQEQLKELYAQYEQDWNTWPVDQGAPFIDSNNNGIFEPTLGEKPGVENANQVIWLKYTDIDSDSTDGISKQLPIGIEVGVTLWTSTQAHLQNVVFKKYRIKNVGEKSIDSLYFGKYADIDIGNYSNDFAGCIPILNSAYIYNSTYMDYFLNNGNYMPPAFGYTLFSKPRYINRTQKMNAQNAFSTMEVLYGEFGTLRSDPIELTNEHILNFLKGKDAFGEPQINPITNKPTRFPLDGDPVAETGYYSRKYSQPGEKKILFSTGPVKFYPNDFFEVTYMLSGGQGKSAKESITEYKTQVITAFDKQNHGIPLVNYSTTFPTETTTELKIEVNLEGLAETYEAVDLKLFSTKDSLKFFNLALKEKKVGSKLWNGALTVQNEKYPFNGQLYMTKMGSKAKWGKILNAVSLRPLVKMKNVRVKWEDGRQDGAINVGEQVQLASDLYNPDGNNHADSIKTRFGYFKTFTEQISPLETLRDVNNPYKVPENSQHDSLFLVYQLYYDGHEVLHRQMVPIAKWQEREGWKDKVLVTPEVGTADNAIITIADPSLINGHKYRIDYKYNSDSSALVWDLWDMTENVKKLENYALVTKEGIGAPIIDGLMFSVLKYKPGISSIQVINNANGLVSPPEPGALASGGFPVPGLKYPGNPITERQQQGNSRWAIISNNNNFNTFLNSIYINWDSHYYNFFDYDWKVRFTENENWALKNFAGDSVLKIPFEIWNIGQGTPHDSRDDFKMIAKVTSPFFKKNKGGWNWVKKYELVNKDHKALKGDDDPFTPYFTWIIPEEHLNNRPGIEGYENFVDKIDKQTKKNTSFTYNSKNELLDDMHFVSIDADDLSDGTLAENVQMVPETGTVFQLLTKRKNKAGDKLIIKTPKPNKLYPNGNPTHYFLSQNYPNPFNGITRFRFGIAQDQKVKLQVYNILGQRVATIINGFMFAGDYELNWEAKNSLGQTLSSGLYIYKLQTEHFTKTKKMIFLK